MQKRPRKMDAKREPDLQAMQVRLFNLGYLVILELDDQQVAMLTVRQLDAKHTCNAEHHESAAQQILPCTRTCSVCVCALR